MPVWSAKSEHVRRGHTPISHVWGKLLSLWNTSNNDSIWLTMQSHLCFQVNVPGLRPFIMPWWKLKRPLTNALTLKHNGHTWANLRYHWWVYLNCSNINKNSGDRYWGKNLTDPKSSREWSADPAFPHFPDQKGPAKSPSPSLLLPVYPSIQLPGSPYLYG